MLLFILSLCGFSGALATRLLDPLITTIASDFATSVGVVAILSSAFALPFGLSQPFLGPTGDAFGKALVVKVAVTSLALCLLASALAPDLTVLFITRALGGVAAGGIMPVCMAIIGDNFPLAVRQVAMGRYIGATLIGQIVGVSVGGMIAEWVGWRGVFGCAAVLTAIAAGAAMMLLPEPNGQRAAPPSIAEAVDRYRMVLRNPRSFVCFSIVFLEGLAIYGIMPFIGELLRSRGAGGLREAGFVIGGVGIGGLLYAIAVPLILKFAKRPAMMVAGGSIAAVALGTVGLDVSWATQMASMAVLGFGFFLLHNSVQTEVTELAPSARASAFSLHAFSFFMGQAIGPIAYGAALPILGATPSCAGGALILAVTGVAASQLLRSPLGRSA
ncbi:putative MFS family arabinose efflux permease [Microvirga lupini]|uniref:Putative MFS family arabinose efflux permease n=1 Tax=Microvirga lupini TaxID=420324 RepID=A0A7W4VQD8_9HYPH|nr:MFS transporter [Microvirga lupini]MBB3021399.1 putative MFS family arabinose efflux permease [Microvirga lupini]